ncbi:hypothetical protein [Sulfurimonas sp.]|uniref:hypothetical protein n=1 Tax=Sulfurimonas sp. TaxID=2022749 RepID=UPI0035672E04
MTKNASLKMTKKNKILKKIIADADEFIRADIARSKTIPLEILNELVLDNSYFVRIEVANNQNSSTQILLNLLLDKNPGVREIASMNLMNKKRLSNCKNKM